MNDLDNAPPFMYEDELPEDMTDDEYDDWYEDSFVYDGVRVGPIFIKAQ